MTATVADPHRLLEGVAEAARTLLRADSLSISRVEISDEASGPAPGTGATGTVSYSGRPLPLGIPAVPNDPSRLRLRTLVNVGELGPGEQRWPQHEYYELADFPETLGFLVGMPVRRVATSVFDPHAEPAEIALLRRLGKVSSLKTAIRVGQAAWGEMWASRGQGSALFADADADLAEVIVALVAAGLMQADAWQRLNALALTDPLTNLANRRAFDEALDAALDDASHRPWGIGTLSVVMADVNDLKRINDQYGHEAGDRVLRLVADHARTAIAGGPGALAARLGGDEFALILPGLGARQAHRRAMSWCALVAAEHEGISLACGLATHPGSRRHNDIPADPRWVVSQLVRAADEAAYAAKRQGLRYPQPGRLVSAGGEPPRGETLPEEVPGDIPGDAVGIDPGNPPDGEV